MRKLAFLVALFGLFACRGDGDELTGNYEGEQRFGIGQVVSEFRLELHQDGNRIAGRVTPPFQQTMLEFTNGVADGRTFQFDIRFSGHTYRYSGNYSPGDDAQVSSMTGYLQPLGCIDPNAGEPCLTDSNGSFTASFAGQ